MTTGTVNRALSFLCLNTHGPKEGVKLRLLLLGDCFSSQFIVTDTHHDSSLCTWWFRAIFL